MKRLSQLSFPRIFASLAAIACLSWSAIETRTVMAATSGVPVLQVDASWPQPLPNKWQVGAVCGTALGPQDHIWILHRPKTLGDNQKSAAPPVIEFDSQGKVVRAWGGPGAGYEWPSQEHGLYIDYKSNVWISGVAGKDYGRILKFTTDGKFLMSIGAPLEEGEKPSNNSTTHLGRQPADMYVDPKANELYVADGDGARSVSLFSMRKQAHSNGSGAPMAISRRKARRRSMIQARQSRSRS